MAEGSPPPRTKILDPLLFVSIYTKHENVFRVSCFVFRVPCFVYIDTNTRSREPQVKTRNKHEKSQDTKQTRKLEKFTYLLQEFLSPINFRSVIAFRHSF